MTIGSEHMSHASSSGSFLQQFPMAPKWSKGHGHVGGHGHGHGQGTLDMAARRVFFGNIPGHLKDADFERIVQTKIGPMEQIKVSGGRSLGLIG